MNTSDKIDLLKLLLDADEDYVALLHKVHLIAKSELGSEGGLPLYDDRSQALLVMSVKEWLCKLVITKA